ncbi:MAG: inositol monophosphatase [Firmicutes bacterium]|nr:inositol monophosphatase [Bacillota bacterium]
MSIQKQVEEIVRQAGALIMAKRQSGFTVRRKGPIDLVTDADREAEALITSQLQARFPDHSIFGEEQGLTGKKKAEYLWLIDPIDGTTNFAHGFPYFCTSLALTRRGKTVFGAVYHPPTETLYTAELGGGAFKNGAPIQVSSIPEVAQSLLSAGFPYTVAQNPQLHFQPHTKAVLASQGVLTLGSIALDLCQVAGGRLDASWENGISSYDIAAGSLIVSEAGGKVSQIDGSRFSLESGQILASNGKIHQELVQLLACKD